MRKMTFLAGAAVGYVLGTRAGQEQYAKIQQIAKKTADSPQMAQAMEMADKAASKVTTLASEKIPFVGGGKDDADTTDVRREPAHAGASSSSNPAGYASNGTGSGAYKPGSTAPGL